MKDMSGGGLIDFQTSVVRIQMPEGIGRSGKGGGNAFHHVGAEPVGDNAKPLCFESGAQEVVGGRLAVGAAGDNDPTADLRGKRRDDMRVDFQGSPARKRRSGTACQMTGFESSFGSGDCHECAQTQGVPPCEWSVADNFIAERKTAGSCDFSEAWFRMGTGKKSILLMGTGNRSFLLNKYRK